MVQIVEQTHTEKVKMYNECSKDELIEMLIEANKHLVNKQPLIYTYPINPSPVPTGDGWKTSCTN